MMWNFNPNCASRGNEPPGRSVYRGTSDPAAALMSDGP